jgi:hypothetical protein
LDVQSEIEILNLLYFRSLDRYESGHDLFNGREIKAQCNYVIEIKHDSSGNSDYLYTGDLWSSAPDGLKSHDIQYWSPPMEFDDSVQPPTIKPLTFVNNFTLNMT